MSAPVTTKPTSSQTQTTPTNVPPPPPPQPGQKITVIVPPGLNVRSGPGTNNSILGGVSRGSVVTAGRGTASQPNQVKDSQGNWWDWIQTQSGLKGWIEVETASGQSYVTYPKTSGGPSGSTTSTLTTGSAQDAPNGTVAAERLLSTTNPYFYNPRLFKDDPGYSPQTAKAQDFAATLYNYEQKGNSQAIADFLHTLGPAQAASLFIQAGNLQGPQVTNTGTTFDHIEGGYVHSRWDTTFANNQAQLDQVLAGALQAPGVILGDPSKQGTLANQLVTQGTQSGSNALSAGGILSQMGTSPQAESLKNQFLSGIVTNGKALGTPSTDSAFYDRTSYAKAALDVINGDPSLLSQYQGNLTPQEQALLRRSPGLRGEIAQDQAAMRQTYQELQRNAGFNPLQPSAAFQAGQKAGQTLPKDIYDVYGRPAAYAFLQALQAHGSDPQWLAGFFQGLGPSQTADLIGRQLRWGVLQNYPQWNSMEAQALSSALPYLPPSFGQQLASAAASYPARSLAFANLIASMTVGQHQLGNELLAHLAGNPQDSLASLALLGQVSGLNNMGTIDRPGWANRALTNLLLDSDFEHQFLWMNNSQYGFLLLPKGGAQLLAQAVANYGGGPDGFLNQVTDPKSNLTLGIGDPVKLLGTLFRDTVFNPHLPQDTTATDTILKTTMTLASHLRKDALYSMITTPNQSLETISGRQLQSLTMGIVNGLGMSLGQQRADAQATAKNLDTAATIVSLLLPMLPIGSIVQDFAGSWIENELNNPGPNGPSIWAKLLKLNTTRGELNHVTIGTATLVGNALRSAGGHGPSGPAPTTADLMKNLATLLLGFGGESHTIWNFGNANGDTQTQRQLLDSLNQQMQYDGSYSTFNSAERYDPITLQQLESFFRNYYQQGTEAPDPITSYLTKNFSEVMDTSDLGIFSPMSMN